MILRSLRVLLAASLLLAVSSVVARPDAADYPPSWSPPTAEEAESRLAGLSFREFVDEAFLLYMLNYPEVVSTLGLADRFGVRNDRLMNYSVEAEENVRAMADVLLDHLSRFDRKTLSPRDRATYDACAWFWVEGFPEEETELFGYPFHPGSHSPDRFLYTYLLEKHLLRTAEDVVDYIGCLYQVDEVVETMVGRFELWMTEGGRMPKSLLEDTIDEIDKLWTYNAYDHPLYRRVENEVPGIPSVSTEAYGTYAADAYHAVLTSVNRAFRGLSRTLASYEDEMLAGTDPIPTSCTREIYEIALAYELGHAVAPEDLHRIAISEVERTIAEIEALAPAFGRPADTSYHNVIHLAYSKEARVYGDDALRAFEEAVARAEADSRDVFDWLPTDPLDVRPTDADNPHYQRSTLDGETVGTYWVPISYGYLPARLPTTTYHETFPGHHLQLSWANREGLPLIQQGGYFVGFAEGWATYAEQLAWELGWFDDDPAGAVGCLSYEMTIAALAVAETGLFALDWDFDRFADYLSETLSYSPGQAEIVYLTLQAEPVTYPAYLFGRIKLLELRETARAAFGDAFSLAAFHELVLRNGGIPLEALERFILDSLAQSDG